MVKQLLPEEGTEMRKPIIVAALAAAAIIAGGTSAGATDNVDKCYEDVHVDIIEKETRTIVDAEGPFTLWTDWADWPGAGPVTDDGRNRGPAAHNGKQPGTVGYREYRYVVVGTVTEQVEVPCPTEPPVTEPPVTEPPVTEPEPTWPDPDPNVCVQHIVNGPDLSEGDYVELPNFDEATGTTLFGAQPCGPVVVATGEPPAPAAPPAPDVAPTLPATGAEHWMMAAVAGFFALVGFGLTRLARR